MLIFGLPAASQSALALVIRSSTRPAPWTDTVLPQRSPSAWMLTAFPALTITTWPVAMYGTASATSSRVSLTYSAVQTMSQRPACRSGMSALNAVFRISISSPSLAATAFAASTSNPMALFGSVSSAEGNISIGGYSMSTQSTTFPGEMRLVGGAMVSAVGAAVAGVPVAGATVAGAPVGTIDAAPPPVHAATSSTMAADAAGRILSITVSSWPLATSARPSRARSVAYAESGFESRERVPIEARDPDEAVGFARDCRALDVDAASDRDRGEIHLGDCRAVLRYPRAIPGRGHDRLTGDGQRPEDLAAVDGHAVDRARYCQPDGRAVEQDGKAFGARRQARELVGLEIDPRDGLFTDGNDVVADEPDAAVAASRDVHDALATRVDSHDLLGVAGHLPDAARRGDRRATRRPRAGRDIRAVGRRVDTRQAPTHLAGYPDGVVRDGEPARTRPDLHPRNLVERRGIDATHGALVVERDPDRAEPGHHVNGRGADAERHGRHGHTVDRAD